jgi:hypothetical protein
MERSVRRQNAQRVVVGSVMAGGVGVAKGRQGGGGLAARAGWWDEVKDLVREERGVWSVEVWKTRGDVPIPQSIIGPVSGFKT